VSRVRPRKPLSSPKLYLAFRFFSRADRRICLNSSISSSSVAPLRKLLSRNPRLHLEHFPSYAPELNFDKGVWSLAKRELANSRPDHVDELMEDIIRSINGIRRSP
jgi:hypothetical protein